MKVAVASHNEKTVAYHLGRAQGFVVAEIEGEEVKEKVYRPVSESGLGRGARLQMRHRAETGGHGHRHGHGCCSEDEGTERGHGQGAGRGIAVVATIQDCDVVIARGAGTGMVRNLTAAGKKLYLTELTSVDEALAAFLKGELKPAAMSV
jgi:predicted Fe-Mo cluster-binding NifX family protein